MTCGNGSKSRSRTCPVRGSCTGKDYETTSCRERNCRKQNEYLLTDILYLFKLLGRSGILGLYALSPVAQAQWIELGLVRFPELAQAKTIKRQVVGNAIVVSYTFHIYLSSVNNVISG